MSSRDNSLWLQLWCDEQTAFHQASVNPLLMQFWTQLNHKKGSRVFVPLCGKSLDMIWLADQGHEVIGVELSPIAVEAFFKENNLHPIKKQTGKFTRWQAGNISIYCGDFFSLKKNDLPSIDMVYDRAALTALPEDIRKRYISQLRAITNTETRVFLLTIEDMEDDATQQQALGIDEEVTALYTEFFDINLINVNSVFESDPAISGQAKKIVHYKAYLLSHI